MFYFLLFKIIFLNFWILDILYCLYSQNILFFPFKHFKKLSKLLFYVQEKNHLNKFFFLNTFCFLLFLIIFLICYSKKKLTILKELFSKIFF